MKRLRTTRSQTSTTCRPLHQKAQAHQTTHHGWILVDPDLDRLPALLRRLDFLDNLLIQKTTWPTSPSLSTTSMTRVSTKVYQVATVLLLRGLRHRQCLSLLLRILQCHALRMVLRKSPASRSTWTTLLILRTIDLHNLSYLLPRARCPLVRNHLRYHRSRLIWIRAVLQMILLVQLH